MKKFRDGAAAVIRVVFGWGIMITLLVGGLSFFGYLTALVLGGAAAETVCTFIYKQMYPILVLATYCMIALGLIKMYICGETVFSGRKKQEKKASETSAEKQA